MTIIVVTQDRTLRSREFAADIAAGLGLDLVSQRQLGDLVAARMGINAGDLQRLVARPPSRFDRWTIGRRRLAWYTGKEIARLAEHGDVVVASWSPVGSLAPVGHTIRVHIGQQAGFGDEPVRHPSGQATVAPMLPARAPGEPRQAQIVCELLAPAAPPSVADCVEQVRRLTVGLPDRATAPPAPAQPFTWLAPRSQGAGGLWQRLAWRRSVEVEIGEERMPLGAAATPEQAIAEIEAHLQRKRLPTTLRQRLPYPPDLF